jgi:hypothetical protein
MDLFHFVRQKQQNATVKDQNVSPPADSRSSNSNFIIDFAVRLNTLYH